MGYIQISKILVNQAMSCFIPTPLQWTHPKIQQRAVSRKYRVVKCLTSLPTGTKMEVIHVPASIHSKENSGTNNNPPLIFIHGTFHGAWCYHFFQSFFSQHGFDSYSVSLRGSGKSVTDQTEKVTIDQHIADLSSLVPMLRLNRPPLIIAHSMGGFIAQKWIASSPHEFERLVLMSSVPPTGNGGIVRRTIFQFGVMRFLKLTLAFVRKTAMTDISVCRDIFFSKKDADFYSNEIEGDHALEEYMSLFKQTKLSLDPSSLREAVEHNGDYKGNVLVVGGSDDWLVDVEALRETAKFWDADLQVFDGYPHDLMLFSKWEEIASFVLNWIRQDNHTPS